MSKIAVERKTHWEVPQGGGAPLLTGPNIYKALFGQAPRVFMGDSAWNVLRRRTYYNANYKCEVCGADCSEPGSMDAHELYSVDYEKGESIFVRCVGICKKCHLLCYHSGRAFTLYKKGSPLYSAERLLEGAEHEFKLLYEWNKAHSDEPKLKAYQTFLGYLEEPELKDRMEEMIVRYEVEFWGEDPEKVAPWEEWHVVVGNKAHYTPYKSEAEVMAQYVEKPRSEAKNPFSGGVFDEMAKILKSEAPNSLFEPRSIGKTTVADLSEAARKTCEEDS